MSETPIAVEVNCETGEVIERPLTPEEIQQREADALAFAEQQAMEQAEAQRIADLKASAKAKLVSGEPLTAEEADTLVL
jgi:PIN domain nuclease of toxin-antitoxin system